MMTMSITADLLPLMDYEELVQFLIDADDLYYNKPDGAKIPDALYDLVYAEVEKREKATGHVSPDSPTQKVQGKSTFAPTKHSAPMRSLDKAYSPEELRKFLDQFSDDECEKCVFTVEPKYDGASLSLEYENGKLIRAITRGDGVTGDDVTGNAWNIAGVPHVMGEPYDDFTGWLRGEVVIPKAHFEEINRLRIEAGEEKFANARNAAAGALRHSDPQEPRRRALHFFPYDSSDKDAELYRRMYQVTHEVHEGVEESVQSLIELRPQLPYEADGVVVKVVNSDVRERLGSTGKHPRWAVAYKTAGETTTTVLEGVTWQTGVNGTVTPVAELEAVELGGTTIRRASLHNHKFITDRQFRIGDTVEITRAGEVIPYVIGVVGESDHSGSLIFTPRKCPACDEKLVPAGNSGQVKCPNLMGCQPQIVGRLTKWASRDAADIDALGPTIIEKLVEMYSDVSDPVDLYSLDIDELKALDKVGDKLAAKLHANIQQSRSLGMRRALIGLSIPHVSEGTAKRLARAFPQLENVFEADLEQLLAIEDIGQTVVNSLFDWYQSHMGKHIICELRLLSVNLDSEEYVDPDDFDPFDLIDNSVAGKSFVITGPVPGFSDRKDFAREVEKKGAFVKSAVSKKTDFVIADDPESGTTKIAKARDLGIPIISPEEAKEMLGIIA